MPRDTAFEVFFIASEGKRGPRIVVSAPYAPAVVTSRWPNIVKFCFPGSQQLTTEQDISFTFVLTDEAGYRLYGHTTHSVNGHAYCFLSRYPWCRFFYYATYVFQANGEDIELVAKLHRCRVPNPSGFFALSSSDAGAATFNPFRLQRPNDEEFKFVDTWPHDLLKLFTFEQLFRLVAAMLMEIPIAVCAANFPSVSRICLSMLGLIYPFEWQHVLVPVTPTALLDVLSAPTPYIVGFITSQLEYVRRLPLPSTLVVISLAADGKTVEVTGCAEVPRLPYSGVLSALRTECRRWFYSLTQMRRRARLLAPLQELEAQEADLRGVLPIFMRYYGKLFGPIGAEGGYDQGEFLHRYATPETFAFMEAVVATQLFDTLRIATQEQFKTDDWVHDAFCRASVRAHPECFPSIVERMPQLRQKALGSRFADLCGQPSREDELELRPKG